MIDFQRVWNWYSRESVQNALVEASKDREVVSVYRDGAFGKRPNIIQYPHDVLQAVAEGTVSFHGSVERWKQPMKLDVGMKREDMDNLRSGWDVFIDPDVSDFEIGKVVVRQILEALKDHGVSSYNIKFSGGKGFHIGIPFESLPEKINLQPTSSQYPEMLGKIIEFLKFYVKSSLKSELLSVFSPNEISQKVGKPLNEIVSSEGLEPFKIVTMDIFSSRHLFRLPYSLHEKNLLVSLPIRPMSLEKFEREIAQPEKVKVEEKFLTPKIVLHDAEALVVEALDWAAKYKVETKPEVTKPQKVRIVREIPEEFFPPCMKLIINGLQDGRKRSIFVFINFLRNMGWSLEKVEKKLLEINEKNYPPLRANYLRTQLRWHFRQDRNLLPPNCDNVNFYDHIGICKPDEICENKLIKNPINYPFRKLKREKKIKIKR